MKLKSKYTAESEVPIYAKFMYEEKDGAWVAREGVDLDALEKALGVAPDDTRIDEFRTRNTDLEKTVSDQKAELGRFQKQFENVDPEQFTKFQEHLQGIQDEKIRALMAEGKVEEAMRLKFATVMDEKTLELTNKTTAYDELHTKHEKMASSFATMQAQNRFASLLAESDLRLKKGRAIDDFRDVVARDWTVDEGGNLKLSRDTLVGESGSPMTESEYVSKELLEARSYLFEPATGGNAKGGNADDKPGGTVVKRDAMSMGRNLDDIAAGKVTVED